MERALRRPAGAWHDWRKLLQPRELPLLLFLRASSKKATTPPKANHNEQAHSSKEKDHSIEGEAVRDAVSGLCASLRARHGGQIGEQQQGLGHTRRGEDRRISIPRMAAWEQNPGRDRVPFVCLEILCCSSRSRYPRTRMKDRRSRRAAGAEAARPPALGQHERHRRNNRRLAECKGSRYRTEGEAAVLAKRRVLICVNAQRLRPGVSAATQSDGTLRAYPRM
jgi:hypothetical protein